MKHCPQCEFTFDDQEQVCDFDGSELLPVTEIPPAFKKVSFATESSLSLSFARGLITSRAGVAILAVVGVMLSALLIGYFDSTNQSNADKSTSQTRNESSSIVPAQVDTVGQARPKAISTQRKLGADELPPSMVKRLLKGTSSQSAKPRDPSATKMAATKRRSSNSKVAVSRRKPENTTRQSQARNQSKSVSRERPRQQHTVATVTHRPARWAANESSHHRKDSKVVAILKKTGSIFKKPFDLIFDR